METNQVQITTMLQFHITFLGLGRRPFFAPGDTRPASTMPGDDYSKQFRRELLQYHHLEVNIKRLNEVNFFCLFLNESQTCMPWKA